MTTTIIATNGHDLDAAPGPAEPDLQRLLDEFGGFIDERAGAIGRVVGSEREPAGSHQFFFWASDNARTLDVGHIVVTFSEDAAVIGVVDEPRRFSDLRSFLDDYFDSQYKSEIQLGSIVTALTVLAIIIGCSGLFALSVYSVGWRTKEISIRKILGASISNVVMLLSRNTIVLMAIGGLLTVPVMYYLVSAWLNDYAYKMPLEGWMFIVPVITVMLLVLITISFQTLMAAKRNPVENMRRE